MEIEKLYGLSLLFIIFFLFKEINIEFEGNNPILTENKIFIIDFCCLKSHICCLAVAGV